MRQPNALTDFFGKLFDTTGFPARWSCGQWGPIEGWTHIVSDLTIAAAYVAIPTALFLLRRRRTDITFPRILWLFIAFILSCGVAHAVEASIFWWPAYRLTAVLKAVTAVVSVTTVVALVKALPLAMTIPTMSRDYNALLEKLKEAQKQKADFEMTRVDIEKRLSEVSIRERRLRDAVGSAKACAVLFEVDGGRIVWETGYGSMLRAAEVEGFSQTLTWEELIGPEAQASLVEASRRQGERGEVLHQRFPLRGHEGRWDLRMTVTPEPRVAGQPAMMLGLVGLVPFGQSMAPENAGKV